MIIVAALFALAMVPQDTTLPGLSPRARQLLNHFTPPRDGRVGIGIRFSDDTVWLGEQVELVTAAWFPRDLRDRLRRQPTLRTPSLAGLWSAPTQTSPLLAESQRVGGRVYDLFVSHQILFPLASGLVDAPPAVLSYAVPASSSFFAPEDRTTVESGTARLVVRPIPAALAARLGSGPTAENIRVQWQVPNQRLSAGVPVTVELVITGNGNVTLWPSPDVEWSPRVRVYAEPTGERIWRTAGLVGGEKRFRYTLVVDSAGVLTLPRVRYPYFDPGPVAVRVAMAPPLGVAVLPAGQGADRTPIAARSTLDQPIISRLVRDWTPILVLLCLTPLLPLLRSWRRERKYAGAPPRHLAPEDQLRWLATSAGDTRDGAVSQALRRRGIARDDADAAEAWLAAMDRHRWGADHPPPPDDTLVRRVVQQLQRGRWPKALAVLPLLVLLGCTAAPEAAWREGLARFADGDGIGAERLFGEVVRASPASGNAWFNLGAARWMMGDDVGSAAAWLQAAQVAPRNRAVHEALSAMTTLPHELTAQVPTVPLSRDELVVLAVVAWLLTALCWRRRRGVALAAASVLLLALGTAALRTSNVARHRGLMREGAVLRVSPVATAPVLVAAPTWTVAGVEQRRGEWLLVHLENGRRGWLPAAQLAPLSRLD